MENLKKLIFNNANIVTDENIAIDDNTDLIKDLGYDSIAMVRLIIDIENTYDIEIDEFSVLEKYGSLRSYLNNYIKFKKFYKDYVVGQSISKGDMYDINISEYRDIPVNKSYIYSMILSNYYEKMVISCSKEMISDVQKMMEIGERNGACFEDYFYMFSEKGFHTRIMKRMIHGGQYHSCCKRIDGFDYRYIPEVMKYVAQKDGIIVSYCKVSDIISDVGNIVIYTEEEYRNRGLAQYLLSLLIEKCIEINICPMYFVDSKNIISLSIAEKLGFYN